MGAIHEQLYEQHAGKLKKLQELEKQKERDESKLAEQLVSATVRVGPEREVDAACARLYQEAGFRHELAPAREKTLEMKREQDAIAKEQWLLKNSVHNNVAP